MTKFSGGGGGDETKNSGRGWHEAVGDISSPSPGNFEHWGRYPPHPPVTSNTADQLETRIFNFLIYQTVFFFTEAAQFNIDNGSY